VGDGVALKVTACIWGGNSYAWGEPEPYPSLKAVLEDVAEDYRGKDGLLRPCWGEWQPGDYIAWISVGPDYLDYPDYVIEVGPRKGLKLVRA